MESVLTALAQDGRAMGNAVLDWPTIEARARVFVQEKGDANRYGGIQNLQDVRPV